MLTADRLRELIDYDPETGVFRWRVTRGSKAPAGSVAGWVETHQYGYKSLRIMIDGRKYRAHRVAWLYVTGRWPDLDIDHVDMDALNNRWSNLREATKSQNQHNRIAQSNNTSGFKGVSFEDGKWRAQICVGGKNRRLGVFPTREAAFEAYRLAADKLHGEFARVA